jgi:inosine-uridine nucleoside N-ribohydrolase
MARIRTHRSLSRLTAASGLVAAALVLSAVTQYAAAAPSPRAKAPVPVIFDSDIGPDVDDVGAAAILNALADNGEARIVGMMCCTSSDWGAPCLDAINTYYGRPDIPIGTNKSPGFLTDSAYNEKIAKGFPNDLRTGRNAPDATQLYRQLLARQPNRRIVICATGPVTNLARLLDSPPDEHSRLKGRDLVAKKVKLLVVMGGRYPEGKEWNFDQDRPAAAKMLAEWPTPILLSGFEIGEKILTGKRLHTEAPEASPVRAAYALFPGIGKERESWDETAILAAVRGPEPNWRTSAPGTVTLDASTGVDRWTATPSGTHTYLIERESPSSVKRTIDELMLQAPAAR